MRGLLSSSRRRDISIFIALLIGWLGSYALLYLFFLPPFSTPIRTISLFFLPIIPLSIALFFGLQRLSLRTASLVFGCIFLLLACFLVLFFGSAISNEEESFGRALFAGIFSIIFVYLMLHAIFVISVLIFQARRPLISIKKKLIIVFVCYALVIGVILLVFIVGHRKYEKHFCESEAHGLYSQIHFLEPITKQEIVSMVRTHEFVIASMTLARKEQISHAWQQTFRMLPFEEYPGITSTTVALPLLSQIPKPVIPLHLQERLKTEKISVEDAELIFAYDRNEPVVWSIEFAPAPMKKMVDLVYELDVRQRRLGIYEEMPGVNSSASSAGRDPRSIKPARVDRPITPSRCYPKDTR